MNWKKAILAVKWFFPSSINSLILRARRVRTGNRLITYGTLMIRGQGIIRIGDHVTINSCRSANPIGGDSKTILFAKQSGRILIGNNTGISNSAIVAQELIEIGDRVLIGAGCKIYDHDFHSLVLGERMRDPESGVVSAPVSIRDGAFIGAHTIILKGITVGEQSVVGAGSVVARDIPPGEIWGGNPVRFIKKLP